MDNDDQILIHNYHNFYNVMHVEYELFDMFNNILYLFYLYSTKSIIFYVKIDPTSHIKHQFINTFSVIFKYTVA